MTNFELFLLLFVMWKSARDCTAKSVRSHAACMM